MLNTGSKKILLALSFLPLFLGGCLQEKIDKEVERNTKETAVDLENEDHHEDHQEEDETVSEEQIEIIEGLEQVSPEEAAGNFVIDSRSELKADDIDPVSDQSDQDEVAKFISQQFFLYHSNSIKAESFLESMTPYFHDDFRALLPGEETLLLQTFSTLQELFISQLGSPITAYYHTDVQLMRQQTEANFYRKYVLKNGKEIYYQTLMRQNEKGVWQLVDDSPSPDYEILPETENGFKEAVIQERESGEQ